MKLTKEQLELNNLKTEGFALSDHELYHVSGGAFDFDPADINREDRTTYHSGVFKGHFEKGDIVDWYWRNGDKLFKNCHIDHALNGFDKWQYYYLSMPWEAPGTRSHKVQIIELTLIYRPVHPIGNIGL